MTFYKTLATATRDDDVITAYEVWEKFASAPRYEIAVAKKDDCHVRLVKPTARTTWKKRFKGMANIK